VYTVLLLTGLLVLVAATVLLWVTLEGRYGVTFAVTQAGKDALEQPARQEANVKAQRAKLEETRRFITGYPEEMGPYPAPATPGTEGGTTPPPEVPAPAAPAPAPAAPAAPAPAPDAPAPAPAAPAAPPAEGGAAPAAPAPAPAAPAAPAPAAGG
jgi:hypothetical protein